MPVYKGSKRIGVLSLGGKEIGKAYLGGVCVFNKEVVYEYDDPIVELAYPTISNTGGEYKPSYSYTQTARGSDGSVIEITSGGSLSYSVGAVYDDYMSYSSSTGVVTTGQANTTTSRRTICTMTVTVQLNGKTGTATATVYQAAGTVTTTYEAPVISLVYETLDYHEGSTAEPDLSFTQAWSDNAGNSGTLTQDTTDYTATYDGYDSGGGAAIAFHLGENGEVITNQKNTSGLVYDMGVVGVSLTANGMNAYYQTTVRQNSRPDITEPVVTFDNTLFQEVSGSGTKKVYFNINATMNDALSITPKYILANGVQYNVVVQDVTHQNTSSSGTTTTNYWAELPYNGDAANYAFSLWCEFTFETRNSRGYIYTDTDEVESSNYLAISSGDFYVRQ